MKLFKKFVWRLLIVGLIAGLVVNPVLSAGKKVLRVGFDVDDTLLFSSPAFEQGYNSGAEPYSDEFWKVVNSSDEKYSTIKKKTSQILKQYQKRGSEIFIITGRGPAGGENLKKFLNKTFAVAEKNIFFNPGDKSPLMSKLKLDIYYGDSDSDITAAQEAGAKAFRILRSPKSSYKGSYNHGKFGEKIIPDSEE